MRRGDLILLLILLLLATHIVDHISHDPYWDYPKPLPLLYDIRNFTADDTYFRILVHFDLANFDSILMNGLYSVLKWPYDWLEKADANAVLYCGSLKSKRLDPRNRVFRCLLYLGGVEVKYLVSMFGDRKDTVYKDIIHVAVAIIKQHGREYLSVPDTASAAYSNLVGTGPHGTLFRDCAYLMDTTTLRIKRPSNAQRDFYCGYNKFHCMKFMTLNRMDTGECVYVSQAVPGRHNDISIWHHSSVAREPFKFINPGHKIVTDGIFSNIGYPCLTRYCHRDQHELSATQIRYNRYHSEQRILIENWYGRVKGYYPGVFDCFSLQLSKAELLFKVCSILTNMIIRHQNPLR